MLKKALIVVLVFGSLLFSQTIEKYSTELVYQKGQNIVKLRPFDYTGGAQRIDIVVAKSKKPFYGGVYCKAQNNGNSWIGLVMGLKNKFGNVGTKVETRFFKGLDEARNQTYFIPSAL